MTGDGLFRDLRIEAVGDAPTQEVWRRYADPQRWAEWAPQIRRVTGLSAPITPRERGWVLGPVGLRVPVQILEVDPNARTWRWRVGVGPASVVMDHGVDEHAGGSRAWVHVKFPRLLGWPYAPVASLALRRLVRP